MLMQQLLHNPQGTESTLFLDRDGVINLTLPGQSVAHPSQFNFIEGAVESIAFLSSVFKRIVVVTNQQIIGQGVITELELGEIHQKMLSEIEAKGGSIDKIYYCPHAENIRCLCRKPSIGMALKARKEFPDINFKRSLMAGDSLADMIFGKRLGMKTVFINADKQLISKNYRIIDYNFASLKEFAEFVGCGK